MANVDGDERGWRELWMRMPLRFEQPCFPCELELKGHVGIEELANPHSVRSTVACQNASTCCSSSCSPPSLRRNAELRARFSAIGS